MPNITVMAPEPSLVSGDVLALIADAVICTDEHGRILLFNRAAEQSFGYSADEVIGQHVDMLLPKRYRTEHSLQVRSFAMGDGSPHRLMGHRREVCGLRKNGKEFPAEAMVARHTIEGRPVLSVVHRDISERKALEEERETIARELDHRVRNVLSVVQSLVSLSASTAVDVNDFKESLLGRLSALAATQSTLRFGVRDSVSLAELLLGELEQYRTDGRANFIIEVPQVAVSPKPAQTLALIFHELATNSAKYGAFKVPDGRVSVTASFTDDGGRLLLEWREAGGPPVYPPTRLGFGTIFIEKVAKLALRAEVLLNYLPEGLVFRLIVPKAKLD
jgi:PAS domain S-box-containing protein